MADQGRAPQWLAKVWRVTRTPALVTLLMGGLTLLAAMWLPLVTLAKATSFIILIIFTRVNLSLVRLRRQPNFNALSSMPSWPLLGAILCLELLSFQIMDLMTASS